MRSLVYALALLVVAANIGVFSQAEITGLAKFDPTGNDFVSTCSNAETNDYHSGMCIAFIQGVLEGVQTGAVSNAPYRTDGSKLLTGLPCIPNGVTNSQLVKVVMRFADKNPEGLQYSAAALIVRSLREAWGVASPEHPCL